MIPEVHLPVAVAAVLVIFAWPLVRHLVTLVHEAGHAVTAVATRRRLSSITLHTDTSGLTVSRGRARGPGMIATAAAGYLAPSVVGLVLAWLIGRGWTLEALTGAFVLLVLLLAWIRNWFGLLVMGAAAAVLGFLIWRTSGEIQQLAATFIAALLLIGGPRPTIELWRQRGRGATDADVLARITWLPAIVWCFFFTLATLAIGATGVWLII